MEAGYWLTHGERIDHIRSETFKRPTKPFCPNNLDQHIEHFPSFDPCQCPFWQFGQLGNQPFMFLLPLFLLR